MIGEDREQSTPAEEECCVREGVDGGFGPGGDYRPVVVAIGGGGGEVAQVVTDQSYPKRGCVGGARGGVGGRKEHVGQRHYVTVAKR